LHHPGGTNFEFVNHLAIGVIVEIRRPLKLVQILTTITKKRLVDGFRTRKIQEEQISNLLIWEAQMPC